MLDLQICNKNIWDIVQNVRDSKISGSLYEISSELRAPWVKLIKES